MTNNVPAFWAVSSGAACGFLAVGLITLLAMPDEQSLPAVTVASAAKKPGVPFEDVRDDLQLAIERRGFVVGAIGNLAGMLERTGADIGGLPSPPFAHANYMLFCSAALAHRFTQADPDNVTYCPFLMYVYEAKATPGRVTVGYRRFIRGGNAATRAVQVEAEQLLDAIAADAVR